jgi:tight adherence protein B
MSGFESAASSVQRLAVLTGAGIPAVSAWRYLADAGDLRAQAVVDGLASSHELPERIASATGSGSDASAWRVVSAVWAIATESGAALAPALERSAGVLRDLAQSAREVETALAGPFATSRIVLALPVIGVLLGVLLGFDVLGAFLSVPGASCLVGGAVLILVAVRWNRRLVRWARDLDATPGVAFELLAVAMAGGMSLERARSAVDLVCRRAGLSPPADEVEEVLRFSAGAGVPVVVLLRAEADELRRAARAEAASRAARLESRLLLPLGLCVLPAFVLVGVAPIGIAILSSTTAQF